MRYPLILIADVALLLLATIFSLLLRDNLEGTPARFFALLPYFVSTVIAAIATMHVAGMGRVSWRYSSLSDYLRLLGLVTIVMIATVLLTFGYNRLDGVARSLPILQVIVGTAALVLARVSVRLYFSAQQSQATEIKQFTDTQERAAATVLIVGSSRLSEMYLQAIAELAPGQVRVAGLLGHAEQRVGHLVAGYPVVGLPEHIGAVLDNLDVHGVVVDRIVVTDPVTALTRATRDALSLVEKSGRVQLQYLAMDLGFEADHSRRRQGRMASREPNVESDLTATGLSFVISPNELAALSQRPHWRVKRAIDVAISSVLLLVLLPVFALVSIVVALCVGFPVMFWQQRPGLGGRPFKVFKFRTMLVAAHSADGRRLTDAERTPQIGHILRKTRLDEIPQLLSILRGDMSFVGPRPLLPRDQSEAYRARLLVPPGLTGWAQVVGGRSISAEDKAALDVWYVCNASVILDLKIIIRTIPIVLFGERMDEATIRSAWADLRNAGVLRGDSGR
jgi:lipopolysaccharide/colanic/teichoic acid biosynthesis glycosyltransferase